MIRRFLYRLRRVVDAVMRWGGYSRSAPMWEAFKRLYPAMTPGVPVFRFEGRAIDAQELLRAYEVDRELWLAWLRSVEEQVLLSIHGGRRREASLALLLTALDAPPEKRAKAMATWRTAPATQDEFEFTRLADTLSRISRLETEKDAVYLERNRLVALLARIFPSGTRKTDIAGWDPAWHNCVFIDLPTGQASWHYHDTQAFLFEDLPPYTAPYDGHTTPQKYERLQQLLATELMGPKDLAWAVAARILPAHEGALVLHIKEGVPLRDVAFVWRGLTAYLLEQNLGMAARDVFETAARNYDTNAQSTGANSVFQTPQGRA